MDTSVDTLVYQLEDNDTNVRWNTLQKLRRIAAVETSHFPVRNVRRFLQCIRRRITGEADPRMALEALKLIEDVMASLGDNVDQILSSILPHLIPILHSKSSTKKCNELESDVLQEEIFQVFRQYASVANDLQAVADLLVNIGLASVHGSIREASLVVLMRLLDERFQKRTMPSRGASTRSAIGRGDKALLVALVQAIIPALEDSNDNVIVSAEEAIAKLESYWGSRFSTDVMKFLSSEDKQTLQAHQKPIADFLQACTVSASPLTSPQLSSEPMVDTSSLKDPESSLSKVYPLNLKDELHFGFLKADIVAILTTNTSNSNADWKKRAAAVEKLYASCKQMEASTLCGLTTAEQVIWMSKLEGLFDILIRLTQDVDVHLIKRALQITQILFRKLSPLQLSDSDVVVEKKDDDAEGSNGSHSIVACQKDAAFYMIKMLAPMVETSANFAGDDDEVEGFVYTLLGQIFKSSCVSVNAIERALAASSLCHRRSQVREEAIKVWIVLLLIADREGLHSENYAPDADVVHTLGCLLGDTNTHVRDLAFEVAAVLTGVCRCNIYALLEAFIGDGYVAERVDWAALRARLRRKQIPELRLNGTLQIRPNRSIEHVSTTRAHRVTSSVEQSLDGISELRMIVPNDESKIYEMLRHDNHLTEALKDKAKSGESRSGRSCSSQQKINANKASNGITSCQSTHIQEDPTTIDVSDKLSALRKKMDQSRQPRVKRTRQSNSQEGISPMNRESTAESMQQMLPRSKSSTEQNCSNPTDGDAKTNQIPKDNQSHARRTATLLPKSDAFTSSPRQPAQVSPQHLQSLQSEACNYDDRLVQSKFIERQRDAEADIGSVTSTYLSPDERPIATSRDPDQIYHHVEDQEYPGYADNNATRFPKKTNGERVVSLATRKRLEAKAKHEDQASNSIHGMLEVEERENEIDKAWKKTPKSKRVSGTDEIDMKTRPSAKQEPRYLEPHEITPLSNPRQDLNKVLQQLRSDDWEANFDGLSAVRRLTTHHASMIDVSKVQDILAEIMKQVQNLRSSVSKNALLALESLCAAFSRVVDSGLENIVPVLLKRCGDSNAFVCESAAASLHTVVLKCSISRIVSTLGSHVSSKSAPIRREVARGIHTLILGHADGILASKELPSILQLVGRCLEDSNNEVRDAAKQSVLYLHYNERMSEDRIKRFLPAAAQAKVDSVLRTVPHTPSTMMLDGVSKPSSSPFIAAKRETTSAIPRIKKTMRQPSSRTSSPSSSNGTRSKINADELSRLETKLDSGNWKDRFDALTEATEFICTYASALVDGGHLLNLFDVLIKRLDDGNAKVNVLALECMEKIVPILGNAMEQVLPNFVPAVTKNLANPRTSSLAHTLVQKLCVHVDNRSLCLQFTIQARSANSRVIPGLLDTLTHLIAQSFDDKNNYVLTRHVLPLALDLLKEAKSGVKEANTKLLRELQRALGFTTVSNAASKLSSTQRDRLAAILQ